MLDVTTMRVVARHPPGGNYVGDPLIDIPIELMGPFHWALANAAEKLGLESYGPPALNEVYEVEQRFSLPGRKEWEKVYITFTRTVCRIGRKANQEQKKKE